MPSVARVLMSEGKICRSSFVCMAELEQKLSLAAPLKCIKGSDLSFMLKLSLSQGSWPRLALPQHVSQQGPILCATAVLLQMVTRDKSASLESKPNDLYLPGKRNEGGSGKSAPISAWNIRRKLIYSFISSAREGCSSILSPR